MHPTPEKDLKKLVTVLTTSGSMTGANPEDLGSVRKVALERVVLEAGREVVLERVVFKTGRKFALEWAVLERIPLFNI